MAYGLPPQTAQDIFLGSGSVGAAVPGAKVNSKSFSATHSTKHTQVGGNRLTGAWHPQLTVPTNRKQIKTYVAKPTEHRIGATGFTGAVGQKIPFNNTNTRPLAGSHHANVNMRAQNGANSLRNQHMTRATARGISGVSTTTRRGGSSQSGFLKPVAGTVDTFALLAPHAGGRGSTELVTVKSTHYFGLHKVVVTKHAPVNPTRPVGRVAKKV